MSNEFVSGMLRAAEMIALRADQCRKEHDAYKKQDLPHEHWMTVALSYERAEHAIRAKAEALRTSTPEQGADDGWRPISTAPKDGTSVDLWESMPRAAPRRYADCRWKDGSWVDQIGWSRNTYITHWRPIPPAPVTK